MRGEIPIYVVFLGLSSPFRLDLIDDYTVRLLREQISDILKNAGTVAQILRAQATSIYFCTGNVLVYAVPGPSRDWPYYRIHSL